MAPRDAKDDSLDTLSALESEVGGPGTVATLTVLFHPDPRRIGQRSRLTELFDGNVVEVSRQQRDFAPIAGGDGEPLADRHLSRRALRLAAAPEGGVRLSWPAEAGALRVDGEPLREPRRLAPEQLARGAILELADRVVLLLHQAGESAAGPDASYGLVGASDRMGEVRRNIDRVADLDVPVLIRGETGTGKELVAQAVHAASRRASRPFVSVNMGAIPGSTAASELFGHRKGSFTGAVADHDGYFRRADGGTLFLDEIGATPPEIQPMLLRALELHEIQPLGSATAEKIDPRFVAATDADLNRAIRDSSFRAALLHRLESFQIFVPPLRARRDDIGRLLVHFLGQELEATGETARLAPARDGEPTWLPASLVARLARLDWPGNVRQLRNLVRQLVISSRGAARVVIDDAVTRLLESAAESGDDGDLAAAPASAAGGVSEAALIAALREHEWRANDAARALGISRSTMYERIRRSDKVRSAESLTRDEILAAREAHAGDLTAMARALEVSRRALQLRIRRLGID